MPSMHLGRMVWQQGQSQAFPEFRTNRMCMRWEDFDDMVTSIQLPEEVSYINDAFFFFFFFFFANHEGNFPSSFLVRNKSCDQRTQACGGKREIYSTRRLRND